VPVPAFAALIDRGLPVLLDGGLATQCEAMGCDIAGPLWSARLLRENPRAIIEATRAYLDAGARIVTTASYQASRQGLVASGLSQDEADALILHAVSIAEQARDEFLADNPETAIPLIAASIGPWGAIRHDGSEYTGEYDIPDSGLREFHRERLELLDRSRADLFACETIPSGREAAVLAELLARVSKPAWVSFSCRGPDQLADGTGLTEAAGLFADHQKVLALGVNCVPPDIVTPAIAVLRDAAPGKAIVVYPNSGESYRPGDNAWFGTPTPWDCEQAVSEWIAAGATFVGGCCRIGPAQIAAMSQSLRIRG